MRRIWSAEVRRLKNGGRPDLKRARPGKIVLVRVKAPAFFSLQRSNFYPKSARFLSRLREAAAQPGCGVMIDCTSIEKIFPNAAVMLLAEIDRALARARPGHVRIIRPQDPIIDAVLNQIGIYERLAMSCDTKESGHESVRHWRVATGVKSLGAEGGTMLEKYSGRLAAGLEKGLYEGIAEAMTNTVHHAYLTNEGEALSYRIGRRWWLLSQEHDGKLTVAFCDLGIGIPKSLPHSKSFAPEKIREFLQKVGIGSGDVGAIEAAIELGQTRTGEKGRGKGLSEIVEAVNRSAEGGVIIVSNRGRYIAGEGKKILENLSQSVRGTLITWSVPMSGAVTGGGLHD